MVPDSGNVIIICQKIDENDGKEIKNYGGVYYFPQMLTYSYLRSLNVVNVTKRACPREAEERTLHGDQEQWCRCTCGNTVVFSGWTPGSRTTSTSGLCEHSCSVCVVCGVRVCSVWCACVWCALRCAHVCTVRVCVVCTCALCAVCACARVAGEPWLSLALRCGRGFSVLRPELRSGPHGCPWTPRSSLDPTVVRRKNAAVCSDPSLPGPEVVGAGDAKRGAGRRPGSPRGSSRHARLLPKAARCPPRPAGDNSGDRAGL